MSGFRMPTSRDFQRMRHHAGTLGLGIAAIAPDPNFSSVVSLLHFDGAGASTTFTDVIGKTWTANGSAQIDTAQSKFGGSAAVFDGTSNCYISTPDSEDFNYTADFTQELWYRPASIGARQFLCGQSDSGASSVRSMFEVTASGTVKFWADNTVTLESTITLSASTWYHLAVTRSGSNYTLWVDGVSRATTTNASIPTDHTSIFCIGRAGLFASLRANGHVDDFRVTKGVARYTSPFSPPTAPFQNS